MLLIKLLEQMSTIAVAAFILSQSGIFKNIMKDNLNKLNKITIIVFFSIVSIVGTYTGIGMAPYALANTRPIGVIVSGYIGGPLVGIIVGAIAGVHRYSLGGFTALSCGIASLIEGLIGGLIRKYSKQGTYNMTSAAIAGIVSEFTQMCIILLISKPYKDALLLVKEIALPMIIVNSLGVVVFTLIIKTAIEEHNRIVAIEAQKVLSEALYKAELKALRSQIRPHFLFNALNTITSFCRTNPLKARELILNLSNYFRTTLKRENDFVTLEQELELIESYLYIEKARFGERLQLYIDIPEELNSIIIPIFVLQPIVENSVKHGIAPNVNGGNIFITVKTLNTEYMFSVKDTGNGMDKKRYEEVITKWPGIGLSTVNERLKLLYGEKYQLNIKSTLGIGTEITFKIPIEGGKLNG